MTLRQRWKQTSLPNKLLIETGALVAFGTLFYAGAAAVQVCLMRQAAKDSAAQVERLSHATDDAIKKAVNASSESLSKTLSQSKESFDIAIAQEEKALRSSVQQSKAALDVSIEASRNDQRAWVAPFDARRVPDNERQMQVLYKNTGKSPALRVRVHVGWAGIDTSVPTSDKDPAAISSAPMFLLAPDGVSNSSPIIPDQVIDSILKGKVGGYVFGTIWYDDIFRHPHWTQFCYGINGYFKGFAPCHVHNTCDDCEPNKKANQ